MNPMQITGEFVVGAILLGVLIALFAVALAWLIATNREDDDGEEGEEPRQR